MIQELHEVKLRKAAEKQKRQAATGAGKGESKAEVEVEEEEEEEEEEDDEEGGEEAEKKAGNVRNRKPAAKEPKQAPAKRSGSAKRK